MKVLKPFHALVHSVASSEFVRCSLPLMQGSLESVAASPSPLPSAVLTGGTLDSTHKG